MSPPAFFIDFYIGSTGRGVTGVSGDTGFGSAGGGGRQAGAAGRPRRASTVAVGVGRGRRVARVAARVGTIAGLGAAVWLLTAVLGSALAQAGPESGASTEMVTSPAEPTTATETVSTQEPSAGTSTTPSTEPAETFATTTTTTSPEGGATSPDAATTPVTTSPETAVTSPEGGATSASTATTLMATSPGATTSPDTGDTLVDVGAGTALGGLAGNSGTTLFAASEPVSEDAGPGGLTVNAMTRPVSVRPSFMAFQFQVPVPHYAVPNYPVPHYAMPSFDWWTFAPHRPFTVFAPVLSFGTFSASGSPWASGDGGGAMVEAAPPSVVAGPVAMAGGDGATFRPATGSATAPPEAAPPAYKIMNETPAMREPATQRKVVGADPQPARVELPDKPRVPGLPGPPQERVPASTGSGTGSTSSPGGGSPVPAGAAFGGQVPAPLDAALRAPLAAGREAPVWRAGRASTSPD
jgi:hypothetical protein